MVDVLSFVDVELEWLPRGKRVVSASRQLAVNGERLDDLAGGPTSSLLVDGVDNKAQLAYLALLLRDSGDGRVHLGYCDQCLDNDGWLLSTTLAVTEKNVDWQRVGFDHENGFPITKEGPWWRRTRVQPPADWQWWTEQERDTELSFSFNRSQYEATIRAELDRLGEKP